MAGCLDPPQSGGAGSDADAASADAASALPPGPSEGLIAYWSMDSLDGGVLREPIGGHDATCIRCPLPATGHIAGALQFRGGETNDYLTVEWPDLALDSGTLSAWIYVDDYTASSIIARPYLAGENDDEDSFLLGTFSYGVAFLEYPGGYDESTEIIGLGGWKHVAGTWTPDERIIYVSGTAKSFPGQAVIYDDTLIFIGADQDLGADVFHFAGAIDDLRVYDRALADFEIGQILSL